MLPKAHLTLHSSMSASRSVITLSWYSYSLIFGLSSWCLGLPGSSAGKESAYNAEYFGSIPGTGRSSGGSHGNPLQYSCLENPLGQRSLVGYSPCNCKELDMTEWLSTAPDVLWTKHRTRCLMDITDQQGCPCWLPSNLILLAQPDGFPL